MNTEDLATTRLGTVKKRDIPVPSLRSSLKHSHSLEAHESLPNASDASDAPARASTGRAAFAASPLGGLCGFPQSIQLPCNKGFPGGSAGEESACNVGDLGSIPGLGRSPGEGKGYPLQCSGLENSMGCIVHGVTKSRTRLSDFHFHPVITPQKCQRWVTH